MITPKMTSHHIRWGAWQHRLEDARFLITESLGVVPNRGLQDEDRGQLEPRLTYYNLRMVLL